MKKNFIITFMVLGCVEQTLTPIFGANNTKKHVCEPGSWQVIYKPSCVKKGVKIKECKICDAELKRAIIPSKGHDMKNCVCQKCGALEKIDDKSKTIIMGSNLYKELGLPKSGDVIIPEKVQHNGQEYTVVGIGTFLFSGNKNITSIQLPNTIKHIDRYAFDGCENLEHCNLPEGLESIRRAAFQCCYKLKEVNFPDSLQWIDDFAYNHCCNLQNTIIELPKNIKKIGNKQAYPAHMFYDCGQQSFTEFKIENNKNGYKTKDGILYARRGKTLVSIPCGKVFPENTYVMPNSVRNLGELSFSRNKNVNTIVISDNLKITGEMSKEEKTAYLNIGNPLSVACYTYSNVNKYETKKTNKKYTSQNGIIYSKDIKKLLAIPNKYKGIIEIPEGVEIWTKEALWTDADIHKNMICNEITEIKIPSTMKIIDKEQIININNIRQLYGTKITISPQNPYFDIDTNGFINERKTMVNN